MLFLGRAIFRDDDDDEYDSELDDFIDNGDEDDGSQDYSKYISEIFGYDKSKYKNYYDDDDDDDDRAMESNFAQQLKEEYVSTKIGKLNIFKHKEFIILLIFFILYIGQHSSTDQVNK